MHRALYIEEILLNIFGHCANTELFGEPEGSRFNPELAALARSCRTFKDPALDLLWEEVYDLSPLVRCLPEACCSPSQLYSFKRFLNEAEWDTLRSYACRIRFIHRFSIDFAPVDRSIIKTLFPVAPSSSFEPLFPNLRTFFWPDLMTLPLAHVAIPSLISFDIECDTVEENTPFPIEVFDTLGERCPNMIRLRVGLPPVHNDQFNAAVSRQLSRWPNLQFLQCQDVVLGMDTVLALPSAPILTYIAITLNDENDHLRSRLGPPLVFRELCDLHIDSTHLSSITPLFSRVRLPEILEVVITFADDPSTEELQEFWTSLRKACPFDTLTELTLASDGEFEDSTEQSHPQLTMDDLFPCTTFRDLTSITVNLPRSVKLTDSDLLDVVSATPLLRCLSINEMNGWKMDKHSGITLGGLAQLLRQCPELHLLTLVIYTQTFTYIPHGLNVSFPSRLYTFSFDFLDSYIEPAFIPGLVTVFIKLGLRSEDFVATVSRMWESEVGVRVPHYYLWDRVREGMEAAS